MFDQLLIIYPCIAQHKRESKQIRHEVRSGVARSIDE